MRAIIPVAGFGKRLKPLTHSQPKVLLNVGGKPILGHIIEKLLNEDIFNATFIIGHLGEKIEAFVKNEYPRLKSNFVVQDEMLGLGHAIYLAHETFDEDGIFIILGDTVFDVDLRNVFKNNITSLGIKKVDDPKRFGVAILKNEKIVKLVEKPDSPVSNLALVGLYFIKNSGLLTRCLEELFEKNIKTSDEFQLTDALQLMIDSGEKMTTFNVEGWYDCGKPETLLSTNRFLLSKEGTQKHINGVVINHPVYIDNSAIIKNSVIGPYTTIARNCVIKDSNIKNTIVGSGSSIEKSLLEDSLIGNDSIIKGKFVKLNSGDSSEIEFY